MELHVNADKEGIGCEIKLSSKCTRMGYSKEQVLSAFAEVSETSKNKEISSLWPAVLCRLREDQVYGQEAHNGVQSSWMQSSKNGGDMPNLCTMRACSSSRPSSDSLKADMNVLSVPPLSFGEKFEDTYEVILILDDREQFTSQGARSKKMLEKICSEFKIKIDWLFSRLEGCLLEMEFG